MPLDAEAASSHWDRPETIGRYRVTGELGRGGMGVVYEAHDPSLDRTVAIKLVTPSRSTPDSRARLAREARTLAQLSHPNVVEIFEIGEHGDDQLFIAMEMVRGRDVRRWHAETSPSHDQILRVFMDVGRGLAAAHAAGLVHRDLKPDNVMVGDDGRVRVLDFGLARMVGSSLSALTQQDAQTLGTDEPIADDRLTQTGLAMGTPAYMAPEQFLHAVDDGRTDQFAFAISLFELLLGQRPFQAKSYEGLAKATATGEIIEPPDHDVPRPLLRVLRRALSPAPADRYRDMSQLLRALETFVDRRRPSRRLLGLGLLGAAGLAVGVWLSIPTPTECPTTKTHHDQLWGETSKARVRDAILGTDVAYAEATWTQADAQLDAFAQGWSSQRHEACQRVRADPQAPVDEQIACLERRRVALDAVIDVLAEADGSTVHNASRTVTRLPSLERCREPSEPDDGSDRPEYEALRSRLAAATASYDIGRYTDGASQLEAPEAQPNADLPPRLSASLALMRGRLDQARGRGLASASAYEAAYFAALESEQQDVACRAASRIAAEPAIPYRERWQWAGHAKAALDRHGDDDDLVRAYERAMCALQADSGRLDDAIERCERALALVLAQDPPDPPAHAQAMADLGAVLVVAENWERARSLWEGTLARSEEAWGPDHPAVATAANELGVVTRTLGERDRARALAERALDIRRTSLGSEHPDLLFAEDLLGQIDRDEKHYERAHARALRVLEQRREVYGDSHPLVAHSLYLLALAQEKLGRYADALRTMQEVSQLEQQLHPLNIRRIATLREQARMAYEMGGGPEEGIRYLEQAWTIVRKSEVPDDHPVVKDLWHGYGETLLALGHAEQALPYLERFVADPRPSRNLPHLSYVLADALVSAGRERERAIALVREGIEQWEGSAEPFHVFQVADMRTWLKEQGEQP